MNLYEIVTCVDSLEVEADFYEQRGQLGTGRALRILAQTARERGLEDVLEAVAVEREVAEILFLKQLHPWVDPTIK